MFGQLTSGSHNLIRGNPQLGPLQDNGGPTFTHALPTGSPALDAGDNIDAPEFDQRGFTRIVGGTIDVGAFERQPPAAFFYLWPDSGTVSAGTPLDLYVFALDAQGILVPDYTGEILFWATDPLATTPVYYRFQLSDRGIASFLGGLTFNTPGFQELWVFDWPAIQVFGYAAFTVVGAGPSPGRGPTPPALDPGTVEALTPRRGTTRPTTSCTPVAAVTFEHTSAATMDGANRPVPITAPVRSAATRLPLPDRLFAHLADDWSPALIKDGRRAGGG